MDGYILFITKKELKMPAKITTVGFSKGGAGKSTVTLNTALLSAKNDLSTLIVDIDEQGTTSKYFDLEAELKRKSKFHSTRLFDEIIELEPLQVSDNISLIRADFDNAEIETLAKDVEKNGEDKGFIDHYHIFKHNIEKLAQKYDLIIFDTPGKKHAVRTQAALRCSDACIVPFLLSKADTDEVIPFIDSAIDEAITKNNKLKWFLLPRAKGLRDRMPVRASSRDSYKELIDALASDKDRLLPIIGDREIYQAIIDYKLPIWKSNKSDKGDAIYETKKYVSTLFKQIGLKITKNRTEAR